MVAEEKSYCHVNQSNQSVKAAFPVKHKCEVIAETRKSEDAKPFEKTPPAENCNDDRPSKHPDIMKANYSCTNN